MELKKWECSIFLIVFIFTEHKREKWLYSETLVGGGEGGKLLSWEEEEEWRVERIENLENIPHFLNSDKSNHKIDVWSPPTQNSYSFNLAALAETLWFFGSQFCWPWIPCKRLFCQAWRYRESVDLFVGSPFPIAPSWDVLEPFILCWVLPTKAMLLQCFHLQEAADYLGLWFFCFPGN